MRELSETIHEPFIIRDHLCHEFEKLVSPVVESGTADYETCTQLLQYLHDQYEQMACYYAVSIFIARAQKFGESKSIASADSSFLQSLRQHAWIPALDGKLYKPSEVYCLPMKDQMSACRRYVPHLDFEKLNLGKAEFIYKTLGMQQQIAPRTIFELLMKWSCNLDKEPLWTLIQSTNPSDM